RGGRRVPPGPPDRPRPPGRLGGPREAAGPRTPRGHEQTRPTVSRTGGNRIAVHGPSAPTRPADLPVAPSTVSQLGRRDTSSQYRQAKPVRQLTQMIRSPRRTNITSIAKTPWIKTRQAR